MGRLFSQRICHSGIKFVTPHQAHTGEYIAILEQRRAVYEAAKTKNPSRWSNEIRDWNPHLEVALNPTREKANENIV